MTATATATATGNLSLTNFKKFARMTIPLGQEKSLLYGKSSSGKTQLLWAYILYFAAQNYYLNPTKGNFTLERETLLFLNPCLSQLKNWNSFVHRLCKDRKHGTAKFHSCYPAQNIDSQLKLQTNGSIIIETATPPKVTYYYKFAHMGTTYQFQSERQANKLLTSFDQSLRFKYSELSERNRANLKEVLKKLFPCFRDIIDDPISNTIEIQETRESSSEDEDDSVINDYYYNNNDEDDEEDEDDDDDDEDDEDEEGDEEDGDLVKVEIMTKNSGFQKVFASLILLFSLVEQKTAATTATVVKYYLIDEPDVLLDQDLAVNFIKQLQLLCSSFNIKLIATTANSLIAKTLFNKNQLVQLT